MENQPQQEGEAPSPEFDIEKYLSELSEEDIILEWTKEHRRTLRDLLSNRVIRSILADQKMRLDLARKKAELMPKNSIDDLVKAAAPAHFADGLKFALESFLAPVNEPVQSDPQNLPQHEAAP